MNNETPYMPTPLEIHKACLEIQRTWTMKEKQARKMATQVDRKVVRWTVPMFRLGDLYHYADGLNVDQ